MTNQVLIPLAFFAMIIGIVYLFVRRSERMALLAKGTDASIFESGKQPSSLKWGLLFIGIGAGILVGKLLSLHTTLGEEPAVFSMICLFGGSALIIYHLLARRFGETPKS